MLLLRCGHILRDKLQTQELLRMAHQQTIWKIKKKQEKLMLQKPKLLTQKRIRRLKLKKMLLILRQVLLKIKLRQLTKMQQKKQQLLRL